MIAYHLKREDEGKYVCIAENNAGRIEAETYLVSSLTYLRLDLGYVRFICLADRCAGLGIERSILETECVDSNPSHVIAA